MKLHQITLVTALVASVLSFTACDRKEPTKTETKTSASTTTNTTTNTATATTASPTVQVWADSMRMGTVMMLTQENPKLTAEQKACLQAPEGNATYYTLGEAEMKKILSPEELKQSDEFYNSAVGKKMVAMTHQQMRMAQGEKVGNPITLTADEQKEIVKFTQSTFAQKVQADSDKATPETAMEKFKPIIAQEKVRCKIA